MKKHWVVLAAVILLVVSAWACGSSDEEPVVRPKSTATTSSFSATAVPATKEVEEGEATEAPEAETTEAPEVEPTEAPENTQPPVGTSRSNPAPPGAEVDVGDLTIVVGEVIRPADEMIKEANSFNSDPEAGDEYILVSVELRCNKGSDEECSYYSIEFNLVGSTGVTREPEIFIAGLDGMLESGELFGGARTDGWLVFQIGVDETDLVLIYEELFRGKVFLAIPD